MSSTGRERSSGANAGQPPELTASYIYDAIAAQALAAQVAVSRGRSLTPAAIRDALGSISDPAGTVIPATASGFALAARRIRSNKRINYDGAGSSLDLSAADGEMFPEIVHWKIQGGRFVEFEAYQCDLQHPLCVILP